MKRPTLQLGILLLLPTIALAQQEKPEPLTRGPIHEAFAEQVNMTPKPGLIVPRKPPEPIDEIPPEYKPEGDDIEWVSGYWGWDDERKDFLWISGVWRKIPPNRKWVAGNWQQTPKGYQWIAGYWNVGNGQPQKLLKAPPETLDNGPNSPAPSDNQFWVPGNWVFQNSAYRWSGGFWHPYQSDWIWIPSHYVWTPRGCVFVSGYWDYRLPSRGHLFAPVYFARRSYNRPIRFCPSLVISSRRLSLHLFVRPRYCHYYFGDYYGQSFVQRNIFPSYSYHGRRHCYDPIFSFCRVHYQQRGINYHRRVRDWHRHMVANTNLRPPRTWKQQRNRPGNRLAQHTHLGNRYSNLIAQHTGKPYRHLTQAQRDRMRNRRGNQVASRQNRGGQPRRRGNGKKTDRPSSTVVRTNPRGRRTNQNRANGGRTRPANRGVAGTNPVRTRAGKPNTQAAKKPATKQRLATTRKRTGENAARTRATNRGATNRRAGANRARNRARQANTKASKQPVSRTRSVPSTRTGKSTAQAVNRNTQQARQSRVQPNSNERNRRAIRRAKSRVNNQTPIRNSTKVAKPQQVIKKSRTQPTNRRIQQPKINKSEPKVQRTVSPTTRPKYTNPRLWDPSRNRRRQATPTRKAAQSTRKIVRRPGRPTTANSGQRLKSYQKAASQRRSGPSRGRASAPKTTRTRSSQQRTRGRSSARSSSPSRSSAAPPSRSRSRAAPSRSTRTYGRSRGSSRSSSRSSSGRSGRSRSRPKK